MTVYYVAHPEIMLMESALVEVETEGHYSRGMTINVDNLLNYPPQPLAGKRIEIGKEVLADKFIRDFLRIVFKIS